MQRDILQRQMDAERDRMTKDRMTSEEFRQMAKPHKYGARATIVDGIRFPSRKEANRYSELKLLERAGKVSDVQCQVRYPLEVNGLLISHYVADFKYFDLNSRTWVIEDSKGFQTDTFRIKEKLMRALYGIEILIS